VVNWADNEYKAGKRRAGGRAGRAHAWDEPEGHIWDEPDKSDNGQASWDKPGAKRQGRTQEEISAWSHVPSSDLRRHCQQLGAWWAGPIKEQSEAGGEQEEEQEEEEEGEVADSGHGYTSAKASRRGRSTIRGRHKPLRQT